MADKPQTTEKHVDEMTDSEYLREMKPKGFPPSCAELNAHCERLERMALRLEKIGEAKMTPIDALKIIVSMYDSDAGASPAAIYNLCVNTIKETEKAKTVQLDPNDYVDLWIAFFRYGKQVVSPHNFIADCRGNPDFLGMKKVTIDIRSLEK